MNRDRKATPTDTYEVVYDMASVIVVMIFFVLLALAILFICQNGGWQGGCGGNCASCHSKCAEAEKKPKK